MENTLREYIASINALVNKFGSDAADADDNDDKSVLSLLEKVLLLPVEPHGG